MVDLITSYVQEFREKLGSRVGPYEASLVALEVDSHLREQALCYQELGSNEDEAQAEAIRAFGNTSEVTRWFQPTKQRTLPSWACEALVLLGWSMPWLHMVWPNPYLNTLQLVLITLPVAFCRRFPVLSWAAGLAGAIFLELWHNQNSGRVFWESWPVTALAVSGIMVAPYLMGWLARRVTTRRRGRAHG